MLSHARSRIVIQGDGVAAQCCARLLGVGDFPIERIGARRPRLPAIMIGATTQTLFQDAFETPSLFDGFHPIRQRVVAWGAGEVRTLPHAAVVAGEAALLDRLSLPSISAPESGLAAWTIVASRSESETSPQRAFGDRIAFARQVALAATADPFSCWMESVERGWLFLVADAPGSAWLLGVGDEPGALMEASKLVKAQTAEVTGDVRHFPAYPRIGWPLCGPRWLACGSGALAFDPLCGDGSGNAIREAILAAAVVKASERGEDAEELAAHYRTRLLAGFQKHLQVCESFYRSGGSTSWWTAQAESAHEGVVWCEAELQAQPPFRYMLRGFELERRIE